MSGGGRRIRLALPQDDREPCDERSYRRWQIGRERYRGPSFPEGVWCQRPDLRVPLHQHEGASRERLLPERVLTALEGDDEGVAECARLLGPHDCPTIALHHE